MCTEVPLNIPNRYHNELPKWENKIHIYFHIVPSVIPVQTSNPSNALQSNHEYNIFHAFSNFPQKTAQRKENVGSLRTTMYELTPES